ncbi:MAG: hypothetical protein ACRDRO_16905 [Pseudonocardiaceae bacterium]
MREAQSMIHRTKIILLVAAVLVITGVGTGIAFARSSNLSLPTPPVSSSAAPGAPGTRDGHHGHGRHSGLLARVEHGEATVNTDHGYQVVDIQRGVVGSANVSVW